jgi:CheY-like chemotaxis protein
MIKKILMVDDDLDFIEACRNVLEAEGYEVAQETQGQAVFSKVQETLPDLVLLDILMQNQMAGFEVADRMFREEKLRTIPVIFLTGYFKRVTLTDKESAMIHSWTNVKGVLDKPVKPAILLELIRRLG